MKLLAIETSATACSVALLLNDTMHCRHRIAPMQQSQLILPMIQELLASQNIALNHIDALAFGCGPGSFTGVRIATSVIQGLGFGLEIPIIPISSLAALAQTAFMEYGAKQQLVAVDARIQEVYWAAYEINNQGLATLLGEEKVSTPAEVLPPDAMEWTGVGSAWEVYRENISYKPVKVYADCIASATGVAQLAKAQFLNKTWIDAAAAHPIYLRDKVAKKSV